MHNKISHLLRIALTMVSVIVLLSSATAHAAVLGGAVVDCDALNLRTSPSADSPAFVIAPHYAAVVLTEEIDGWYKAWYAGFEGYMAADFLSVSDALDADFGVGTIRGTEVRMRASAGYDSVVLCYNYDGVEMEIIGVAGEWYKVRYNDREGFVHSDFLELEGMSNASSTVTDYIVADPDADGTVQDIIDTAMKYIGVPYVWAGTSPKGFDCSGFVYYVFNENGYSTNRTASSLMQDGDAVDKSELKPGDVLGFAGSSGSGIGHCGIYIGDDQFIHASSGTGNVTITSLSSDYYAARYYGARRIA